MNQMWFAPSVLDKEGRSVLGPADVRLVHKAVLARCDMDDGVRDGIVGNPLSCKFNPATLACTRRRTAECLTPSQVEAVKKLYSGPVTSRNEGVYSGGKVPGSELGWVDTYFSADRKPGFLYRFDAEGFRYTTFMPDAGPSWKPIDLNFDRD
jgi:Tannase and feruloyl esterase